MFCMIPCTRDDQLNMAVNPVYGISADHVAVENISENPAYEASKCNQENDYEVIDQ